MPLALTYDVSLIPEGGYEVFKTNAEPVKHTNKEAAGHIFHEAALLAAGIRKLDLDNNTVPRSMETPPPSPMADDSKWEGMTNTKTKKKKKGSEEVLDKYALIGLAEERYLATEKMIKDAYREACLLFHPDKCGAAMMDEDKKAECEERFKSIQEAYDTLSDPAKRRCYDSTDEFNDNLPLSCEEGQFYSVFGLPFKRQSRWSEITPVPELGDENTPIEEVQKFYDFWFRFKSWREFPDEEENDLDSAECREHKRWMERQNAKMREKNKKKADKRLMNYIETAYRMDPRIIAMKAAEKAEKEAKKQAKFDERNKKRIEEEAAAKAEADRLAAEEALAKAAKADEKKEREKEKKLVRKERARLRTAVDELKQRLDAGSLLPSPDQTEDLCSGLELQALRELCDALAADPPPPAETVLELCNAALAQCGEGACRGVAGQADPEPKSPPRVPNTPPPASAKKPVEEKKPVEDVGADWTEEEVRLLGKGLKKFPKGYKNRWEAIAAYLGTRSSEEVIKMSKAKFTVDGVLAKPQGNAFETFLKDKTKHASNKQREIESARTSRDESFSDVEIKLTGEAAEQLTGQKHDTNGDANADPAEWTLVQEQALVKAVKAFPKGSAPSEKERWALIAKAVPGKSATLCFKHMPLMLARMRANKAAA